VVMGSGVVAVMSFWSCIYGSLLLNALTEKTPDHLAPGFMLRFMHLVLLCAAVF
jgi:hypothetical protein